MQQVHSCCSSGNDCLAGSEATDHAAGGSNLS